MADSTEGHSDVRYLGLLVPTLIALIAGLVIHSFIIAVNVTDWWKGRPVTPVDHIVTSLGISRMCAQCANTIYLYVAIFFLNSLGSHVTVVITSLYVLFTNASYWLTSLLSIVLCLKISNFHSRLFLYLRGVIAHRTVYFIGASWLLSAFNCLMSWMVPITQMTKDGTYNTNMLKLAMNCTSDIHIIYTYVTGSFFPLFFSYISSAILFTSLYHHTTKMKMSSNLSINLETYYSVMKFISLSFIYNTLYFIGYFLSLFYYCYYCLKHPWFFTVLDFLPVLHSSYLIYRTAKLRSQMSKVLQN